MGTQDTGQRGEELTRYKRSRFSTRLPAARKYTRAHYWLDEREEGVWRIGFTKFATRMLGDLVEYSFAIETGQEAEIGQEIGWIEGFKAVTNVYAVASGEFLGANSALESDITAVENDPYGAGWLYEIRGEPEPESLDVQGYTAVLDATIDKMLQSRHKRADDD